MASTSLTNLASLESINAVITLTDKMTVPIQNITTAVNKLLDTTERAGRALNSAFNSTSINTTVQKINLTKTKVQEVAQAAEQATQSQAEYTEQIEESANASKGLSGLKGLKSAFDGFNANPYVQATKKLMEMSDQYTQMRSKINVINDGSQSTADLQNKIFASANRSRSSYASMADTVASLSNGSGNTFLSNDETIQFAENMSKMFTTAGASQEQFQSASQQLSQALGTGVVSADALNSAFADAPNGIQTLADTMGMPVDKLMEMAKTGQLTADMIKDAMLGSTEQINSDFANTPQTWGQIWTTIGNYAQKALEPILSLVSLVANNLDVIIPIILGVASAFAVYELATNGAAIATQILSTATQIASTVTQIFTAVQSAFNAVLALNPIALIIISIILLIAIIFAVVAVINKVTGSSISAVGIIIGIVYMLVGIVQNVFISLLNFFLIFANFFKNFMKNPVAAVEVLFLDLVTNVLSFISTMAQGIENVINKIPGVKIDITSNLSKFQDLISKKSKGIKDKAGFDDEFKTEDFVNLSDKVNNGYKNGKGWQDGIGNKVSGFFNGDSTNINPNDYMQKLQNQNNYPANAAANAANNAGNNPTNNILNNMAGNVSNIAGNTGIMANEATTDDENMKYLRQMAERDVIMRYVTPSVSVDMSGMSNHVRNGMDIDGVIDHMVRKTTEAVSVMAEG